MDCFDSVGSGSLGGSNGVRSRRRAQERGVSLSKGRSVKKAKRRYVVDEEGKRTAVIVEIAEYRALLDAREELDCIRAYDAAKKSGERPVAFERAVEEIERTRE